MIKTEAPIAQALTHYIQTELNSKQLIITMETALIETGLIDSLSIFKLILFMEDRFIVKIQAEDIVLENFANVKTLTQLVQAKRQ